MADRRLLELTPLGALQTGTSFYCVEGGQSYRAYIDQIANLIINNYGLLTTILPAGLMTEANAELIINGLNNATYGKLNWERIESSGVMFDIDGGVFSDTYSNASSYDGGPIA